MDNLVPDLYGEYGRYVNATRAFPFILDGAKLVERRLLWSLYEVSKSNKNVKSATVVGHCIGHYHPHGDQSCYSSLVTLVRNGLVIGQGNFGSDNGIDSNPPAAQRYTEVKPNPDILNMAFEYVKSVPFEKLELDFAEPLFLPTKLPICLIGESNYCEGIGFGYSTKIPIYKKSDLIKRLRWLLDGKTGTEPVIKPITDCKFDSDDSEFKSLLTTGRARIQFQGKYHIESDNSIIVTAIPPSKTFLTILKKFDKEISVEKSLGFQDISTDSTKVRFTVIRPRSLKLAFVVKTMKSVLCGSCVFECNVVNSSGKVVTVSIDDMLVNIYKVYCRVVEKVLKDRIEVLDSDIEELKLIEKIKPLLSIELKTNPDNLDLVISNIAKGTGESVDRIKEVFEKYTLARIFRIKTNTKTLLSERNLNQSNLDNLHDYVWKEKYLK